MAIFLNTIKQIEKIEEIFKDAKKKIVIISPYIDLPPLLKKELKNHLENTNMHLTIIFRKDENKSEMHINMTDLEFFKQFKNVKIGYTDHLHAKYYGDENCGISTSLNLIKSSFSNNIEIGIYVKKRYLLNLRDKLFKEKGDVPLIDNLFRDLKKLIDGIIKSSVFIYEKTTKKKGYLINKSSIPNVDIKDTTDVFINETQVLNLSLISSNENLGYCIRTGNKIPFKVTYPYSKEAWYEWNKQGANKDFPEKYCHKTGKESNKKTCFNKPILESND